MEPETAVWLLGAVHVMVRDPTCELLLLDVRVAEVTELVAVISILRLLSTTEVSFTPLTAVSDPHAMLAPAEAPTQVIAACPDAGVHVRVSVPEAVIVLTRLHRPRVTVRVPVPDRVNLTVAVLAVLSAEHAFVTV